MRMSQHENRSDVMESTYDSDSSTEQSAAFLNAYDANQHSPKLMRMKAGPTTKSNSLCSSEFQDTMYSVMDFILSTMTFLFAIQTLQGLPISLLTTIWSAQDASKAEFNLFSPDLAQEILIPLIFSFLVTPLGLLAIFLKFSRNKDQIGNIKSWIVEKAAISQEKNEDQRKSVYLSEDEDDGFTPVNLTFFRVVQACELIGAICFAVSRIWISSGSSALKTYSFGIAGFSIKFLCWFVRLQMEIAIRAFSLIHFRMLCHTYGLKFASSIVTACFIAIILQSAGNFVDITYKGDYGWLGYLFAVVYVSTSILQVFATHYQSSKDSYMIAPDIFAYMNGVDIKRLLNKNQNEDENIIIKELKAKIRKTRKIKKFIINLTTNTGMISTIFLIVAFAANPASLVRRAFNFTRSMDSKINASIIAMLSAMLVLIYLLFKLTNIHHKDETKTSTTAQLQGNLKDKLQAIASVENIQANIETNMDKFSVNSVKLQQYFDTYWRYLFLVLSILWIGCLLYPLYHNQIERQFTNMQLISQNHDSVAETLMLKVSTMIVMILSPILVFNANLLIAQILTMTNKQLIVSLSIGILIVSIIKLFSLAISKPFSVAYAFALFLQCILAFLPVWIRLFTKEDAQYLKKSAVKKINNVHKRLSATVRASITNGAENIPRISQYDNVDFENNGHSDEVEVDIISPKSVTFAQALGSKYMENDDYSEQDSDDNVISMQTEQESGYNIRMSDVFDVGAMAEAVAIASMARSGKHGATMASTSSIASDKWFLGYFSNVSVLITFICCVISVSLSTLPISTKQTEKAEIISEMSSNPDSSHHHRTLTIATYNVHLGFNRRYELNTKGMVNELNNDFSQVKDDIDVICFQEVGVSNWEMGSLDLLDYFSKQLEMPYGMYGASQIAVNGFNVAMLSRYPFKNIDTITKGYHMPNKDYQSNLIVAQIDMDFDTAKPFSFEKTNKNKIKYYDPVVMCGHFKTIEDKDGQTAAVTKLTETVNNQLKNKGAVILTGDFNAEFRKCENDHCNLLTVGMSKERIAFAQQMAQTRRNSNRGGNQHVGVTTSYKQMVSASAENGVALEAPFDDIWINYFQYIKPKLEGKEHSLESTQARTELENTQWPCIDSILYEKSKFELRNMESANIEQCTKYCKEFYNEQKCFDCSASDHEPLKGVLYVKRLPKDDTVS